MNFVGMIYGIPGQVGMSKMVHRYMSCSNWVDGLIMKWCCVMRTFQVSISEWRQNEFRTRFGHSKLVFWSQTRAKSLIYMVRSEGLEPPTPWFEAKAIKCI